MSVTTNSLKKFINTPSTCVENALEGVAAAYPGLLVNPIARIIMCEPENEKELVGIVSGGGSGHEPFAAGYVGRGMLNAAVCGSVFASPPILNIASAIMNLSQCYKGGVLVLILNYTGDVLNFGQAIEKAKDRGYNVAGVIVGDDCALINTKAYAINRRGLCGMLFAIKIAGGMADAGSNLNDVVSEVSLVTKSVATFGICSMPCSVPGATETLFKLHENELGLGVGIHGEAGSSKITICTAKEVVEILLKKIISTLELKKGNQVCAIVNNLGGSSQIESFIIASEVEKQLVELKIPLERMYVGSFMTSLEMGGIQICLLNVTAHPTWVTLLDAKTDAPSWTGCVYSHSKTTLAKQLAVVRKSAYEPSQTEHGEISDDEMNKFKRCVDEVAKALIAAEEILNKLDMACGDGDCGSTFRSLADGVLQQMESLPFNRPKDCLLEIADIGSTLMGGTSGGLYSLLLRGAARNAPNWKMMWQSSMETIMKYTEARVGYRSMMDALIPAFQAFELERKKSNNGDKALQMAVSAAETGCTSTRDMEARVGRASYVSKEYLTDVDAGAYAVTVWLNAIYAAILSS